MQLSCASRNCPTCRRSLLPGSSDPLSYTLNYALEDMFPENQVAVRVLAAYLLVSNCVSKENVSCRSVNERCQSNMTVLIKQQQHHEVSKCPARRSSSSHNQPAAQVPKHLAMWQHIENWLSGCFVTQPSSTESMFLQACTRWRSCHFVR